MTFSSADYWEDRYASGHDSGGGSRGAQARFKAEYVNAFISDHPVRGVVELGCGDGHQLGMLNVPGYIGFDVSPAAIARCRALYAGDASKHFHTTDELAHVGSTFDLALSLDVIYHLIEDDVYARYLADLFGISERWVIVYTSDVGAGASNEGTAAHVWHRPVTADIAERFPAWDLVERGPGMDGSAFYVYGRRS